MNVKCCCLYIVSVTRVISAKSHFVFHFVVLFSRPFIKGVNVWGLGTTYSSYARYQRPIFFWEQKLLDADDV